MYIVAIASSEHDPLPDATRRPREVRRGDGDHRHRHRDAHQREARDVGEVEGHLERVREVGPVDEHPDQAAEHPRQRAGGGDVARQAPTLHEDQRERHQCERPERQQVVEDEDEGVGVVGQQPEEAGEGALRGAGVVARAARAG